MAQLDLAYSLAAEPADEAPLIPGETLKRAVDLAFAVLALTAALPLMACIALAIRLDSPGPILFSQTRYGRHRRPFRILKFRTMCADAEGMLEKLMDCNDREWPQVKIAMDPRITRVGQFLRRTSLDELPQLINVIRGEMSLVGPRPHTIPLSSYEKWQLARLTVHPGITGPAQIWHRHGSFAEECRADLHYIRRRSLWFDLYLIRATLVVAVFGRSGR